MKSKEVFLKEVKDALVPYEDEIFHIWLDDDEDDSDGVKFVGLDDNTFAFRVETYSLNGDWKLLDERDYSDCDELFSEVKKEIEKYLF